MSLDTIIVAIKALLVAVPNVGDVHDYVRLATNEQQFLSFFKDATSGRVLGWTITRESTNTVDRNVGAQMDTHIIVLRGWMGLKDGDATEKTFQALIESVRATFNAHANRKLSATAFFSGPCQVRQVTQGILGAVLCHYCELALPVQEYPK